jgi:putative GTP pyrophosphokinase
LSTKSEIDRLGDRLRSEKLSEADLRELDNYRREFAPAYDHVIALLKNVAKIEPSGRPAKSTPAIVEKLRRQSIRLTQMQDIAGCRIVVSDVLEQD